ncbi:MAG TPA: hypothetical protein VI072_23125 [Polyangiaceae bacterium]
MSAGVARVMLVWCAAATCVACARGCGRNTAGSGPPSPVAVRSSTQPDNPCPTFARAETVGRVQAPNLTEISGVAMSKKNPGVLWVHNDSGHAAELFAIARDGRTLAQFVIDGARNADWEDLALGPGPERGESYLHVGDIGGNRRARLEFVVYRVREPEVASGENPMVHGSLPASALHFTYPDGHHDAETLFFDPKSDGDLYVVTKDLHGASHVYRATGPIADGSSRPLTLVASLHFPRTGERGSDQVTSGAISPSGEYVLIKTYTMLYLWVRLEGASIADTLRTAACRLPLVREEQGEALTFAPDGTGYLTTSEGRSPPIYFFRREPASR